MIDKMLCHRGCYQKASILRALLAGEKKTPELIKALKGTPHAKYGQIYKYLDSLRSAGLVDQKARRWYIPPDKSRAITEALDPCFLKLYVAAGGTALAVLRKLPMRIPFLLSAGVYWGGDRFRIYENLDFAQEIFLDSGAQQFYRKFDILSYPYTFKEYVDFGVKVNADLVATLDLPLDILAPRGVSISNGVKRTTEYGVEVFSYAEKTGIKQRVVPVIQGYDHPDQWLESIDQYIGQGIDSEVWGVGSLCMAKSRKLVKAVVKAVAQRLNRKRIHIFGLALNSLREVYRYIDSYDTSAWIYWAKMDGNVFIWDPIGRRFIHLQAREGKRYDTTSLMRINIESLMYMTKDLSNLKELDIKNANEHASAIEDQAKRQINELNTKRR